MSKRKELGDPVDPVTPNKRAKITKEDGEISDDEQPGKNEDPAKNEDSDMSEDSDDDHPTSECKEAISACLRHASEFARFEQMILEARNKHNISSYQILLYVGLIIDSRGAKRKTHIAKHFALSMDVLASIDDIIRQIRKLGGAGQSWFNVVSKNQK